ncbi:MAG: ribokinase [Bacilli bacterium]|nr:ribokinase [Bacilli bacterium]
MREVYVLGSLNMDLSIESDVFPNLGETMRGHNLTYNIGGKGLNQAIAASKLGAKVHLLGAIGKDPFGDAIKNYLAGFDFDCSFLSTLSDHPTGTAIIVLEKGDNRILLDLGANLAISHSSVDSLLSSSKKGDIFLTQLENNLDATSYALAKAKDKGLITILDPAPMDIGILPYLHLVDILTPNEGELLALLREVPSISSIPSSNLLETLGKDGYRLYQNGLTKIEGKAIEIEVKDTTGAGDTFNGALAYRLSLGYPLDKESLDYASLVASISTSRKGASISCPTKKEVDEFLKTHPKHQ